MKPNIFKQSTKELTQDGFLSWLLLWGNTDNEKFNFELNTLAKDFIKLLINKNNNFEVKKVEVIRQWRNIDILVHINNEITIIIEDKTNSGVHDNQLEIYKKRAIEKFQTKEIHFIYIKTGNESIDNIKKINEVGYSIIFRKDLLNLFRKFNIENEIFNDYLNYIEEIEKQTNKHKKLDNIKKNWYSSEGFYIELQNNIKEWTDWKYVPNQMGGFLGFYFHWKKNKIFDEVYIQIENNMDGELKLLVKVGGFDKKVDTLYHSLDIISKIAKENSLSIKKPNKFRVGETSTLCVVNEAFIEHDNGELDFENLLIKIHHLINTVDDFCS